MKNETSRVFLESTGGYERVLLAKLHEQRIEFLHSEIKGIESEIRAIMKTKAENPQIFAVAMERFRRICYNSAFLRGWVAAA